MKASTNIMSQVQICDSISEEVKKLQLVYTFLSQISDVSHAEGVQFIGNWNIEYFNASLATLGETIENMKEIIS